MLCTEYSVRHWHLGEKGEELHDMSERVDQMVLTCGAGWRFAAPDEELPGENTVPDPLHPNYTHLRDIYFSNDPNYTGRFTVPVLFDMKTDRHGKSHPVSNALDHLPTGERVISVHPFSDIMEKHCQKKILRFFNLPDQGSEQGIIFLIETLF